MYSKVVFIGLVWPEPDTTAAGSRMLQLIRFFIDCSEEVHFASTAVAGDYSYPLEELGVQTHSIELNDPSFDRWIADIAPDIVVFDRFVTEEQFSWRVRENCPSAMRILDTEDLHFLRETRRLAVMKNSARDDQKSYDEITLRELASIYRCDLTLIISEVEIKLLKDTFKVPESLLHYLPFLFSTECLVDFHTLPSFSERLDFMTIGNWKHGPNKDSVNYLKNEVWPEIRRRLPEARIHIFGAYGPGEKSSFHDPKKGFLIEGWIKSKRDAFTSHRVCLAPLRFGAGLKGKLFDALRFGTPSVTTSVGVEGMANPDAWSGFVCDQPDRFVEEAVKLYSHENVWLDAQSRSEQILHTRFSEEVFLTMLGTRISEIHENLITHRSQNITGALLWHHSAQSTKYLSKWIESKNKANDDTGV
jgi:hypothetical protein